jgi:hypothetical protein
LGQKPTPTSHVVSKNKKAQTEFNRAVSENTAKFATLTEPPSPENLPRHGNEIRPSNAARSGFLHVRDPRHGLGSTSFAAST